MRELCINTYFKLKVGDVLVGTVYDDKGNPGHIFMRVLEQVTKEDYINFTKSKGLEGKIKRDIHDPALRFWRIEVLN